MEVGREIEKHPKSMAEKDKHHDKVDDASKAKNENVTHKDDDNRLTDYSI